MNGRSVVTFAVLALATSLPATASSSCIPITDAGKPIGATKCVSGKVVRVKPGARGVRFFDFCEEYRTCPFTVVVFASDLKQIGDVRRLEGRQIEIDGEIKSYDGRGRNRLKPPQPVTRRRSPHPALAKRVRRGTARQIQPRNIPLSQSSQKHSPKKGNATGKPARPQPARIANGLTPVSGEWQRNLPVWCGHSCPQPLIF